MDRRFTWLGLSFGLGFYLADAGVAALGFNSDPFLAQLFNPAPRDFWLRASILVAALAVGICADRHPQLRFRVLNRLHRNPDHTTIDKQRVERFLEISESIIVGLDSTGRVNFINDRGCNLLGYKREELINRNWFDLVIPEHDRDTVLDVFNRIMRGDMEMVDYYENTICTRSGDYRYITWHNVLELDANGHILGTLSSGQDITERKQIEDKLRLASVVFESTNQGVLVTDADAHILSVNPAFTKITGFTADQVVGTNPRFLKSGRHDAAFYEQFWHTLKTTGNWTGEIWDRRANGEPYPSWQTISAIRDGNNDIIQYVSVFSDITPMKNRQENLDFLAHHDPLTGLPNRMLMDDRLDHALKRRTRKDRQLAVLFLDLNDFKPINDTLGHATGDQILKQVAQRLQGLMRGEDTIARFGGDEFVIILEGYETRPELEIVAEKILKEIARPIRLDSKTLDITASIGIAIAPEDGETNAALLSAADVAMYKAKRKPGNGFCFHEDVD